MSLFMRQTFASAASSRHGLNVGSLDDPARLTWGEVHEQATRMAGGLAARRIGRHGSVAVLAAGAEDVAPLGQAIWMRRAALTMLQQPTPRTDLMGWLDDTVRATRLIRADVLVVGEPFLMMLDHLAGHDLAVCTVESLRNGKPIEPDDADERDIAMRQLTSGSTGRPKAVEISHRNFAANTVAICAGLDIDPERDTSLSWLPLSHDLGMIACLCIPMQLGMEAVVVRSDQFIRRPVAWAELISRYRATITAGPDFAYSILTRILERTAPNGIDLSSLRIACNGGEPIESRDMARFAAAGAAFGLRPSAPTPVYGLAEATLAVAFGAPAAPPIVDQISRRTVTTDHRAEPAADDADAQRVVSVGLPVPGMEVRITRDGTVQGPREIGAIELHGPLVADRYLTEDGPVALAHHGGWFDTGDLGYLDEAGRVYVCGRTKDLIVIAGMNLYPHDIERAAATVDGVRKGCVIALRVDTDREGFVVLAEAHGIDEEEVRRRISREVADRVNRRVGHSPREVRLFPAGALPKTPSGKLRRDGARGLLTGGGAP